jgi:hypothetical protein
MVGEEAMKEEAQDPGLPDPFQVFRPSGDYILIRAHGGKTVGHAGLAEETLEEGIFEVLIHLQAAFHQFAHVHVVPAGHVPFVSGHLEYGTVGLAETAPVALGDFIVNGL